MTTANLSQSSSATPRAQQTPKSAGAPVRHPRVNVDMDVTEGVGSATPKRVTPGTGPTAKTPRRPLSVSSRTVQRSILPPATKPVEPLTPVFGLQIGAWVVNPADGRYGPSVDVEKEGRVRIACGGAEVAIASAGLILEVPEHNGVKAGMDVLTDLGTAAVAAHIFDDGSAVCTLPFGRGPRLSKTFVPPVDSIRGICRGTTVLDTDGQTGVATIPFADGSVTFQQVRPGGFTITQTSKLVLGEVPEYGNFRAGVIVADYAGQVGVVESVFADDVSQKARYTVGEANYAADLTDLSPEVDDPASLHPQYVMGQFCATAQCTVGQVARFFEDGRVAALGLDDTTTVTKTLYNQVSHLGECRAGTVVLDEQKKEWLLTELFENGTVQYATSQSDENGQVGKLLGYFADDGHSDPALQRRLECEDLIFSMMDSSRRAVTRLVPKAQWAAVEKTLLEIAQDPRFLNNIQTDDARARLAIVVRRLRGEQGRTHTTKPATSRADLRTSGGKTTGNTQGPTGEQTQRPVPPALENNAAASALKMGAWGLAVIGTCAAVAVGISVAVGALAVSLWLLPLIAPFVIAPGLYVLGVRNERAQPAHRRPVRS